MKRFNENILKLLTLLSLLAFVLFTSCEKSTEPTEEIDEAKVLVEYLEQNGDYVNTGLPSVKDAAAVRTALLTEPEKTLVIDVREKVDFDKGRIPGAKNIPFKDVYKYFQQNDMTKYNNIFITCYTGQTSGYAVGILRLLGYNNVWSLKWGMCSWHTDFAERWQKAISNIRAAQFVKENNPKPQAGNYPKINTGKKTGLEILKARAEDMFNQGYANVVTITHDKVFENPASYFIVNYWPKNQHDEMGHIPGAIQYTPKQDLKSTTFLKTLPTNKTIVLYCYTGQTSSFLAGFLRALGYDAKSLMYGANGMIYDKMKASTGYTLFKDSEIMNYDYEK